MVCANWMVNVLAIKVNGRAKIALYRYAQIYALVEVSVVKVLASVTKVTPVKRYARAQMVAYTPGSLTSESAGPNLISGRAK